MNADELAPVTPITRAPQGRANHACPRCGSEWWNSVIVLDADRNPTGYSVDRTACNECGLPIHTIA